MATTPINPTGVLLGTSETTVFTATGNHLITVRFNNVDTVTRILNVWLYTGAGPGGDATLVTPKALSMAAGTQLEIGPYHLSSGYKFIATSDAANKINAVPTGVTVA